MHKKSKGGAHSHSTPIFTSLEDIAKLLSDLFYPFRLYPAELGFRIKHSDPPVGGIFPERHNASYASHTQANVNVAVRVGAKIYILIECENLPTSLFESDETIKIGLPYQRVITEIRLNVVDHDIPSP